MRQPTQDIHVPAQRSPDVPPDVPPPDTGTGPQPELAPDTRRPGKHRAAGPDYEPVRSTGTVARHRAAMPADEAEEIIIGIAAAARYLGYDKPDSFRRARTRYPIPGEGKTGMSPRRTQLCQRPRPASSASMVLRCARIGTRAGESGRARTRLACSFRLLRSSSPAVSPLTS